MRTVLITIIGLLFCISAQAKDQAVCNITSVVNSDAQPEVKVITVDLRQDYRYLVGKTDFLLLGETLPGSIEIKTWLGKGGRVSRNTFNLAGMQLSNAGFNAVVSSEGSSFSALCKLNLE